MKESAVPWALRTVFGWRAARSRTAAAEQQLRAESAKYYKILAKYKQNNPYMSQLSKKKKHLPYQLSDPAPLRLGF